ncbi:hypothetical protein METHP15_380002 [Pseudomonas sp. P15-2025]
MMLATRTPVGGATVLLNIDGLRGRPVGAGLPAKRPALLANFHPPFTVAAATVFAGKPRSYTGGGPTRGGGHSPS